jgi:hypothetical protein
MAVKGPRVPLHSAGWHAPGVPDIPSIAVFAALVAAVPVAVDAMLGPLLGASADNEMLRRELRWRLLVVLVLVAVFVV